MSTYRELIEFMNGDIDLCIGALRTDRALGREIDRTRRFEVRIEKQREIVEALARLEGLEK